MFLAKIYIAATKFSFLVGELFMGATLFKMVWQEIKIV
jgi:hypothetical protein